jgi:hypothetical protein
MPLYIFKSQLHGATSYASIPPKRQTPRYAVHFKRAPAEYTDNKRIHAMQDFGEKAVT